MKYPILGILFVNALSIINTYFLASRLLAFCLIPCQIFYTLYFMYSLNKRTKKV